MTTPTETAHRTIKPGMGFSVAAAGARITAARLMEILRGRTLMTAHDAIGLGAVTGTAAASLAGADVDDQLPINRNAAL